MSASDRSAGHVTALRRISEFLALRRNTTLLLVALVVAGTGEKVWLGFAPKYIEALGGSVLVIGGQLKGSERYRKARWQKFACTASLAPS